MSFERRLRRVSDLKLAVEDERTLNTVSSAGSVRSNAGHGLAMLPFLTINDIIELRASGFERLEDLEERILDVPEAAWPHVVELVRAQVLQVEPSRMVLSEPTEDEGPRCLAYTKSGPRCRNRAREGSKYCASHKGYRPSQAELEAREAGLITAQ